jgi:digeranylgeranylglycerophospholipid reductase
MNIELEKADVVVIGAGPAGSIASRILAKKGWNVVLIEKGFFPGRKKACGGMLTLSTMNHFEIPDSLVETQMQEETFVFPWYRRTTQQQNITVQRTLFDEYLTRSAVQAGVQLMMSSLVTDVKRISSGNMEICVLQSGSPGLVKAKSVFKKSLHARLNAET